jgi:hypothetical protein
LAERGTKIALGYIFHVEDKLFVQGFVGAKQFCILFVYPLDPSLTAHTLGNSLRDDGHGIAWHQAGQDKIQQECEKECD